MINFRNGSYHLASQNDYNQVVELLDENNKGWFGTHFLLKVATLEALNNAVEHGEFPVVIETESTLNTFKVRVKDSGPGFTYTPIDETILTETHLLKDRGRGLYIIHNVMDEVRFNKAGNEILLIKSLE